MSHWRPIVNGFGRAEPPGQAQMVRYAKEFPASAEQLRAEGVQYVVVHAARFPDGAEPLVARALANPACRLARRIGSDYLFELVAGAATTSQPRPGA